MQTLGLIRIGELTPSENVLLRKYRNKFAYAKLRDRLQQWIMVGMANARIPKATRKRTLTIIRYARHKQFLLDRGNFVGGCKPLLDAATRQGLILDDREDLVDDIYQQAIDAANGRVDIIVAEG
jgi:hypothetical protein